MCWICEKIVGWFKKKPVPLPPRELELIGWGQEVNSPHHCFPIHRLPEKFSYAPVALCGSDRDGDFWTLGTEPNGMYDICRGSPDTNFIWIDEPDPYVPITPNQVLEALKRSGKVTDEDIISAKAAAKLMGII